MIPTEKARIEKSKLEKKILDLIKEYESINIVKVSYISLIHIDSECFSRTCDISLTVEI